MKIKRFNEKNYWRSEERLRGNWKSTDKILKVTIMDSFEVPIDIIRKKDKYYQNLDNRNSDDHNALYYAIEEYYYFDKGMDNCYFELVDGDDNPIDNEEEFDEYVRNIKNFNL